MLFDLPENNIADTCQCQNLGHVSPGPPSPHACGSRIGDPLSSSPGLSPKTAACTAALSAESRLKGGWRPLMLSFQHVIKFQFLFRECMGI